MENIICFVVKFDKFGIVGNRRLSGISQGKHFEKKKEELKLKILDFLRKIAAYCKF